LRPSPNPVPSNTERGWRRLKLYSDTPGGFTRDYRALTPNAPTQECHTRRRIDPPILDRGAGWRQPIPAKTRSRATDPRPIWTIPDATPEGRGNDGSPSLECRR